MHPLDSVRGLSQEDKLKIVAILERYSEDFLQSELWKDTLPLDHIAHELAESGAVPDFLTEVYGEYDPKLKDKAGQDIGIGDSALLEGNRVGFIVGLDPASGLLDIEVDDSDEVTISAAEVTRYDS